MRRFNRKTTLKVVKELDAFPKVPEDYQTTTSSGGTVSILTFILIIILIVSEIRYYSDTRMKYEYDVDDDLFSKLRINVDVTVAMPCINVGADVVDVAGDPAMSLYSSLQEEPTTFELSEEQADRYRQLSIIRDVKSDDHAIQDILYKSGLDGTKQLSSKLKRTPGQKNDACRVHGHVVVNKVAGNFHVTLGKTIPHPRGHAHLSLVTGNTATNFSHRIDHFSFGVPTPGIINPLDGEMKTSNETLMLYQYFIQVVPTKVKTRAAKADTSQFAVTERVRVINHSKGSHGVTGIFFKYELSSIKVKVTEVHEPYSQFLVRLCGIVGGIFATSGMLHSFIGFIFNIVCCQFKYKTTKLDETVPRSPGSPSVAGHKLVDDQNINLPSQIKQPKFNIAAPQT
ncbi:endoplasmic reticulum-Golgi intermediate compartment protein 2-like [Antedon mediterranea]|uniref:endoplasmic reticulum-Golgi intermediate compartment protein 2-like n=1 Tax=Antedon mediterranea TaxID=105859 RepID=UPI003AF6A2BA